MNLEYFSGIQYTLSFRFPEYLDALYLSEIAESSSDQKERERNRWKVLNTCTIKHNPFLCWTTSKIYVSKV